MKIASSNVSGRSASVAIDYKSSETKLEVYTGRETLCTNSSKESLAVRRSGSLFLAGKNDSYAGLGGLGVEKSEAAVKPKPRKSILEEMEELRFKTLQAVFKKFKEHWAPFQNVFKEADGALSMLYPGPKGIVYTEQQTRYEYERVDFEMKGQAQTADGRKIEFDISVSMTREFYEQTAVSVQKWQRDVCDPLMIQLSGSPSLTDTKISFDIDMDGMPNQISFAGPNSGFLALDENGNGKIDDGSELFGPSTGNGFGELAAHDADGNGWIDENDPVFDRLRIWTKDSKGADRLIALGEAGIGAIYLGSQRTEFQMKDSANNLAGIMRSSGAFLFENGAAGSLHQVDLVR